MPRNPITPADLAELDQVLAQLDTAAQAVRDLADRCKRKGDILRAGQLEVGACWKVERARQLVAEAFA